MDTSPLAVGRGTLIAVTDQRTPYAGYVGVVVSVDGDLITTGPLVSPHGNLFGDRHLFYAPSLDYMRNATPTRAQYLELLARADDELMPAAAA